MASERSRPDAALLERRALAYLQRYPASRARLEAVLLRRALPEARAHAIEPEALRALIRAVVERLAGLGLVDDDAYAEGRARALLRRGRPPLRVRHDLGQAGIEPATIDAIFAKAAAGHDLEHAAAVRYARRRGLGPFRPAAERAERRERDLRALMRQGFGLGLARAVVDGEDLDDPLA